MSVQSDLVTKVRSIIQEFSQKSRDIFIYNSQRVFELGDNNVNDIINVYRNDVVLPSSGNWSYDSTTNRITFQNSVSFVTGDVIKVDFDCYPNYSDTEIQEYLKTALVHLSVNSYEYFEFDGANINPEPDEKETNLIALITSILIKPDNKSYRLPDISITVANKLSTDELIKKTIAVFKRNTHGVFGVIDTVTKVIF